MKLRPIYRFQDGGAAPSQQPADASQSGAPQGGAPQGGGGQDPVAQIAQLAMQALQNQDCNAAMQVCQAFVQMLQQSQGGGQGAPQGGDQGGEPVYRHGGVLVRRMHH